MGKYPFYNWTYWKNNFNVKLKGQKQYIYLQVYSFKHLLNYIQIRLIIKEFN